MRLGYLVVARDGGGRGKALDYPDAARDAKPRVPPVPAWGGRARAQACGGGVPFMKRCICFQSEYLR